MANLLAFPDYAREFAQSMWRRLPVVMSHLSVAPIPAWLTPVFHAMVFLPLVGWLVVRVWPAAGRGGWRRAVDGRPKSVGRPSEGRSATVRRPSGGLRTVAGEGASREALPWVAVRP